MTEATSTPSNTPPNTPPPNTPSKFNIINNKITELQKQNDQINDKVINDSNEIQRKFNSPNQQIRPNTNTEEKEQENQRHIDRETNTNREEKSDSGIQMIFMMKNQIIQMI
jgi:hypothetical protein